VKHELERIEVPGEHDARGRTWRVVESAFAGRQPVDRSSHWPRVAAIAVALAVLLAAALSPPGRAVIDEVREVVGVERAQPALFSLPAAGQLLVASDAGVWVVQQDGSKRLLGEYREASWSPFGRFVVAARENELAAVEPDGDVRWTLSRPGVASPRWTGIETDTRIAYIDRTGLRVVAGDGTGDRLLVAGFRGRLAWRPGAGFVLGLATPRDARVVDVVSGRTRWRRARMGVPTNVSWSTDGRRLLVASRFSVSVYDGQGAQAYELGRGAAPLRSAALSASGQSLAFAAAIDRRSQLWVVPRIRPDASAARRLFTGAGTFDDVTWTPDGRWILVTWPEAQQWVFVRANGAGIRAVSNVSEQFRSRAFPRVEGWCCAP
jgi:WD40-like Beta Propeller Repeat